MPLNKDFSLHDDFAEYLFGIGENYKAQEYLGAHRVGEHSFVFRVWAPNADKVYLCGDFNGWGADIPMHRSESGIWAVLFENAGFGTGSRYKFLIERDGRRFYKSDPYAFSSEIPAGGSSRFAEPSFDWNDKAHMDSIKDNAPYFLRDEMPPKPMNIYEVHLGSWRRHWDGSFLSYYEAADQLADYAVGMGYTHVELLPVAEHPLDASWGYQVCGYYAPTSRFGPPEGFMYLVDRLHRSGIGVILDWVPAHFPKDEHGLFEFDGGPLYEYSGRRKEHPSWGTRCFDVARNQVRSFLISNALYWLGEYHVDGLRVDAVASMLYLDFDRRPGEWDPNPDGGNIDYGAVEFFKKLNAAVTKYYPDRFTVAEESTAFPDVTKKHGLGFNLKWNMGWMHDTLDYISAHPLARAEEHWKLSFGLSYAFSENYVLAISHDEVVHCKKSLLDKCAGRYNAKFANLRAYLAFMITHPGKNLLFMGAELGQFSEWKFDSQLEWFLLDNEKHYKLHRFVAELNAFYKNSPELYAMECKPEGFRWIFADNAIDNVIAYERIAPDGKKMTVAVNFSGLDRYDYEIPVGEDGSFKEIFNTDEIRYGGFGFVNEGVLTAFESGFGGKRIRVKLPAFGAVIFQKGN